MRGILLFLLSITAAFGSYQKGLDEFRLHRYRDAHESFLAALKNKEMPGESAFYLGKIFLLGQELNKAYKYFLLAFKYNSQQQDLPRDFQSCIEELRNAIPYNEFHELYTKTYQKGVFPIPAVYYRVKNLQNRLEFSEILTTYETVKAHPSFKIGKQYYAQSLAFIQYYAAVSYLKVQKDTIKAIEAANLSVRSDPELSVARKLLTNLKKKQQNNLTKLLKKAQDSFLKRDFETALKFYQRGMETDPKSPEARKGIEKSRLAQQSFSSLKEAEEFISQARYEMALKKLKFAVTAYPDNFEALNLRKEIEGKILEKLNLKKKKEESLENREREYFSQISEGNNYLNSQDFQYSVNAFKKALEIRPDSKKAADGLKVAEGKLAVYDTFQKGLELFRQEKYANALKLLIEVQKAGVQFERLYHSILAATFHTKNYGEVITLAENHHKLYPRDTESLYFLARAYEESLNEKPAHLDDSIKTYNELIGVNPSFLDSRDRRNKLYRIKYAPLLLILGLLLILIVIATWLYRTKDLRKKRKYLTLVEKAAASKNPQKLVKLYETMPRINLTLDETLKVLPIFMSALVDSGRHDDALKIGPRILGAMPNHQQVLLLMAKAYYELKIFNPGLMKYYDPLFASDQMTDEMVEWIGSRILSQDMDSEKTLPVLWQYFELHPEHQKCRKILLKFLKEEDSMSRRLVEMMETEVKFNPRDISCRLKLAQYYLDRKQVESAIRLCEEVINLNATERKLHEILYGAYEHQKNLEALLPLYNSLLELYPNSIVLQEAQNKILLVTGRPAMSQTELQSYQKKEQDERTVACVKCGASNEQGSSLCCQCKAPL
jgi:tetratricopeptide (TPR) repeat protein